VTFFENFLLLVLFSIIGAAIGWRYGEQFSLCYFGWVRNRERRSRLNRLDRQEYNNLSEAL